LGLEPEPLLERFELGRGRKPVAIRPPEPELISPKQPLPLREDQPFFDPVNVEVTGGGRREGGSGQRIAIILALLVALGLVASRFVPLLRGDQGGANGLPGGIQQAVDDLTGNDVEPTPTPDLALIPGAGDPITSTNRNELPIALPTLTATRPSLPATLDVIRLRLDVTERTWMQVTVDGEIVFEGLAVSTDGPFEWEAQESVHFVTGNAAGVFVTINDLALGKLGGRAEVVDETWETTGSG
jgi:hypothetical protein